MLMDGTVTGTGPLKFESVYRYFAVTVGSAWPVKDRARSMESADIIRKRYLQRSVMVILLPPSDKAMAVPDIPSSSCSWKTDSYCPNAFARFLKMVKTPDLMVF
jgi:hypothetical protein